MAIQPKILIILSLCLLTLTFYKSSFPKVKDKHFASPSSPATRVKPWDLVLSCRKFRRSSWCYGYVLGSHPSVGWGRGWYLVLSPIDSNWNSACTKAVPILWLRLCCPCCFRMGLSGPPTGRSSELPNIFNQLLLWRARPILPSLKQKCN